MTTASKNRFSTFTTASLRAALAAALPIISAGCMHRENVPPPAPLENAAVTDGAMERRMWEPSSAVYNNTSTVANNPGFEYITKRDLPLWLFGFVDLPIFITNVAVLPYSLVRTPPGVQVESKPVVIAPTSNGNPALPPPPPPEQQGMPQTPPTGESANESMGNESPSTMPSMLSPTTMPSDASPTVPAFTPSDTTPAPAEKTPAPAEKPPAPTENPEPADMPTTRPASGFAPAPTTLPSRSDNR